MALNSQESACLCLLNVQIKGVHYDAQYTVHFLYMEFGVLSWAGASPGVEFWNHVGVSSLAAVLEMLGAAFFFSV